jgi:hypothetical protein
MSAALPGLGILSISGTQHFHAGLSQFRPLRACRGVEALIKISFTFFTLPKRTAPFSREN